ncbi:DNA polymerase III, subunits gamma and tau [Cellulomonas flavigena DSM 20109]|uniref:DNA-directed DNA polymerase n=1 Tax=Cellulomonas flavigena (strain ATCC 482 / DSM 20109 / BCRC 11376 / JCM 18109 / NBRC 3775 / NCIMB 8073 / NRS 134) TaxID=446466 RepID=D5ULQ1_CELFN|nr:DNA polymerase III subunit gamma and tau [Cellulomonas flavigena]ADG76007.1 DNA polymerase III, subunits gamma and tau [Cellulomonas flavigena DSM 20109]
MTTALYRRYRPESFAEVIGQDHVTAPLRQALRSGQANHAYLFSGPRGCGKTTSARILARCLNCAEGPTDTPCGVCPSCVELARGGAGSLDVVEIDAASHGGVDDARELRERATFAPARDRYKVFILDEAHMVSPQGFNALLKIVEEPPPHVKFIFATTEPDKVIGTIRSRTHHYPFRLVPPDVLVPYLEQLCATEGVPVGSGVLPLVVRAGGGSVRDTLSVLDQLIAGSGEAGLGYEGAVSLLGFTHTSLLDDLVDAIAARDGASAFRVVERVIVTGHEPRRFVEDLLERLRDLIVLAASGEAAMAVLRDLPPDQLERMRAQSVHLGASELSRSADLANAALTEMVGATSPRLHLELLMARLLLPGADDSRVGLGARIDRLERGVPALATAGPAAAAPAVPAVPATVVRTRPAAPTPAPVTAPEPPAPVRDAGAAPAPVRDAGPAPTPVSEDEPAPARRTGPPAGADHRAEEAGAVLPADDDGPVGVEPAVRAAEPVTVAPDHAAVVAPASAPAPAAPAAAAPGASAPAPGAAAAAADTEMLRRRWPDVLTTLRRLRLPSWALVNQHAQILELDATTLRLGFAQPGLVTTFRNSNHGDVVSRALAETLGVQARVEAVLDEPGGSRATTPAAPAADVPLVPGTISPERAAASWDVPAPTRAAPVPASTPERPTSAGRSSAPTAGAPAVPDGEPTDAEGDPAGGRAARPTPPWEAEPATAVPVPAPTPARPAPATGAPAGPSDASGEGVAAPVAHPDDDIPPGDEPDDPWHDGPPPRSPRPRREGGPGQGAPARGGPAPVSPSPGGPSQGGPSAPPPGASARERGVAAARAAADRSRVSRLEPDEPSPDDPTIGQSGLVGVPLVAQLLGGRVIDEQIDGA